MAKEVQEITIAERQVLAEKIFASHLSRVMPADEYSTLVKRIGPIPAVPPKAYLKGTHVSPRPRLCYLMAGQYMTEHLGGPLELSIELIHGTIQGKDLPPIDHAWAELINHDIIFDGALQTFYEKPSYLIYFNAKEEARYTSAEMIKKIFSYKKPMWQAWHKFKHKLKKASKPQSRLNHKR